MVKAADCGSAIRGFESHRSPFFPSLSSLRVSIDTWCDSSVIFQDLPVQIKGLPYLDVAACANSGFPYNLSIRELGAAIGLRVNTV